MELTPGKRGQSTVIGFILLFGFLILVLSLFQAEVVPNQNAEIEFQHYQEARDDMTELYTEIITLGRSSSDEQVLVPVSLGTDYPPRLLFLNPPPAAGSVESTGDGTIELDGEVNAAELCEGDATTGLVYSPGYHVTTQPDIRYDNGLLYVETADGENAVLEHSKIVDEGEINLYRLNGSLRTRSEAGTLPIELTGGVSNSTDNPQTVTRIRLPSELSTDKWNTTVLPPDINATDAGGGRVELTGFSGQYTVNCYSVGLGQRP